MAIEQQNWKFSISAEVINGEQSLHIHPENITDLIIKYDYQNEIMPSILTRVNLDKNFLDFIIKNADDVEVQLTIKKFTQPIDDASKVGPSVDLIKGTYLVSVGSDINYNKELDYRDKAVSDLPMEDKFKETYLGLISKDCLDANKVVANEVVHTSFMQDLVLSYLLQNCHLLIEPFDHNEMHNNLVIPPLDTMSSLIDYLNTQHVFYNTKYILFFDEPKVTYLLSRSGSPTKMKGEAHSSVILNMRSATDDNNLTIGMNDNQEADAYELDVSVLDSNYNIDKDTTKMIDSIDAIINPSIENSVLTGDIVKTLKSQLKGTMKNFLASALQHALASLDIGGSFSGILKKFTHAFSAIQKVSFNLQSRANEVMSTFASTCTQAVGSQIQSIQSQCNNLLNQLGQMQITKTIGDSITVQPYMTAAQKSVQKSLLDSRFISVDISRSAQKEIKSAFSKALESSASSEYNKDFIDNWISAVTYVNLPDVTGQTANAITSLNNGVIKNIEEMQRNVNSQMGNFDNFTNSNGQILKQLQEWRSQLTTTIVSSNTTGSGISASGDAGGILRQILEQESNFSTIISVSDQFGTIAKQEVSKENEINKRLQDASNNFMSMLGSIQSAGKEDIKSQFVSNTPTRIFGNGSLSVDQIIEAQMRGGGCFGDANKTGMADTWSDLSRNIGGLLNFGDLASLTKNLLKFDLSNLGALGLSHFNFDLNIGKIGSMIGRIVGTKILKTKNDNPNMLKNIKSEIELSKNQLSVNKYGLDPEVFTPNKTYTIKNYNGHANKDGSFILNKKILVFIREDDKFVCNTQLSFSKIIEGASNSSAQDVSNPNPQR